MQVEVNLHRIGVGVIPSPSDDADVLHYVLTGGKERSKIVAKQSPTSAVITLKKLRDDYFVSLPNGAKETNSLNTEKT